MTILLVVVGLLIVGVSYFISESFLEKKTQEEEVVVQPELINEDFVKRLLEENQEKFKESAQSVVNDTVEEELIRVDDALSHISNEKIMAVSEFSDQLLEKIEQNHKEVVFLYDMLNAKENEMKEFVQEIDKSKVFLEELANKELEKQKMLQHKRIQKELEKQLKRQEELERERIDLEQAGIIRKESLEADSFEEEEKTMKVETQMSPLERMGLSEQDNSVSEPIITKDTTSKEEIALNAGVLEGNQNQVILDLYNEGKSIMEIAKLLGKGQGEVKLVIDLFQGAGR